MSKKPSFKSFDGAVWPYQNDLRSKTAAIQNGVERHSKRTFFRMFRTFEADQNARSHYIDQRNEK